MTRPAFSFPGPGQGPAGLEQRLREPGGGLGVQARIIDATQAAIAASLETPYLVRISAGNYGGRLGKNFIYLHPDKQPPLD